MIYSFNRTKLSSFDESVMDQITHKMYQHDMKKIAERSQKRKNEKLSEDQLNEIKDIKENIKKIASNIIKKMNSDKDDISSLTSAIDQLSYDKLIAKFEYTKDKEDERSISFWPYSSSIVKAIKSDMSDGTLDQHFLKYTEPLVKEIVSSIKANVKPKTVSMEIYGIDATSPITFYFSNKK